ncbi:MAG: hypothetical protein ACTSUD_02430, partial [Alphaproteobacteria bacterium]
RLRPSFETPPAAAPQDERGAVRQATEIIRLVSGQTLRALFMEMPNAFFLWHLIPANWSRLP